MLLRSFTCPHYFSLKQGLKDHQTSKRRHLLILKAKGWNAAENLVNTMLRYFHVLWPPYWGVNRSLQPYFYPTRTMRSEVRGQRQGLRGNSASIAFFASCPPIHSWQQGRSPVSQVTPDGPWLLLIEGDQPDVVHAQPAVRGLGAQSDPHLLQLSLPARGLRAA